MQCEAGAFLLSAISLLWIRYYFTVATTNEFNASHVSHFTETMEQWANECNKDTALQRSELKRRRKEKINKTCHDIIGKNVVQQREKCTQGNRFITRVAHHIIHWLWLRLYVVLGCSEWNGYSGTYTHSKQYLLLTKRVVSLFLIRCCVGFESTNRAMTAFSMIFIFILCVLQRVVWLDDCRWLLFWTTIFIVLHEDCDLQCQWACKCLQFHTLSETKENGFFFQHRTKRWCVLCSAPWKF